MQQEQYPTRQSIRLKEYDYAQAGLYFITICTHNRECLFGNVADGKMVLNDVGKIAGQFLNEIPQHYPHVEMGEFIVMPNHIHCILKLQDNTNTDVGPRHGVAVDDTSIDNGGDGGVGTRHGVSTNDVSTNDVSTNDVSTNDVSTNDVSTNGVSTNDVSTNGVSTNDVSTNDVSTNDVSNNMDNSDMDNAGVRTRHGVSLPNNTGNIAGPCHGMPPQQPSAPQPPNINQFGKPIAGSVSVIINQYKSSVKRWCNKNGHEYFKWQTRFHDHIIRNTQSYVNISEYIINNPTKWKDDKFFRK